MNCEVLVPPQSTSAWIRVNTICPCGLGFDLSGFLQWTRVMQETVTETAVQRALSKMQSRWNWPFVLQILYSSYTLNNKKSYATLLPFQFSSTGIWRCLKAVWEHWKTFCQLILCADIKLFLDVRMTGVNLFGLVVGVIFGFCFLFFWQGEQGDLGDAGYPGDPGLPGPQVTKRTFEMLLC